MDQALSDGLFEVVWPSSPRQVGKRSLAKRHASLNGKVVAGLWDFLFRGDEMLDTLEEGLRQHYPEVKFVNWREFGNIHGGDEAAVIAALPGKLKALGVDAVITTTAA